MTLGLDLCLPCEPNILSRTTVYLCSQEARNVHTPYMVYSLQQKCSVAKGTIEVMIWDGYDLRNVASLQMTFWSPVEIMSL